MKLHKTYYPTGSIDFILWFWDKSKTEIWFANDEVAISSASLKDHLEDIERGILIRKNK